MPAIRRTPVGDFRAALALTIGVVLPDGTKFRGSAERLQVRVYPLHRRGSGKVKPRGPRKKAPPPQ